MACQSQFIPKKEKRKKKKEKKNHTKLAMIIAMSYPFIRTEFKSPTGDTVGACPRRPVVCSRDRSTFSKWTIRPPFSYWHIFTGAMYLRNMAHPQMHDCFKQITNCVINVSILTCGILGHCGVYSFWASIIETGLHSSRIDACTLQPGILDWTFGNPSIESADLIFHEL